MKFIFIFFLSLCAHTTMAFKPAPFTPNVVDQAGVLSTDDIEMTNAEIKKLRDSHDIYAAVYLVKTLNSTTIEDAAFKTFNAWKLGDIDKQNGILFMFATDDRKARIEVGSGIEGDITDLYAKRLLDHSILPYFKTGEYSTGILTGLTGTAALVGGTASEDELKAYLGNESSTYINTARGVKVYLGWLVILLGGFPLLMFLGKASPRPINKHSKLSAKNSPFSSTKKKGISFFPTIFILIFLCINPGIFIFFLGGIDDIYIPIVGLLTKLKDSGILYSVAGVLFLLPMIVKFITVQIGRARGNQNPDLSRTGLNYLIFILNLNSPILPISIGFAIVLTLAGVILFDIVATVGLILIGFTGLLYFFLLYNTAKLLMSPAAYNRQLAQGRLDRIKFRVEGPREIFGKSYSYTRSMNSSSGGGSSSYSGSSSSSSSSGGGRSSGGGASSSW